MVWTSVAQNSFEALVRNALDFLDRSYDAYEAGELKYSVIDFYTALELLLKARLLKEHWTLIISDPNKLDRASFEAGDFKSVSLQESLTRLSKVIGTDLTPSQREAFTTLGRHRNKMVHFFHNADRSDTALARKVGLEQLRAWYVLHTLLLNEWDGIFDLFKDDLEGIDRKLRRKRAFLEIIHEEKKDLIQRLIENGAIVSLCPICEFEALLRRSRRIDEPQSVKCEVCDYSGVLISIECPRCEQKSILGDPSESCLNCGTNLDEEIIQQALIDKDVGFLFSDDEVHFIAGNCSFCDSAQTVLKLGNETYFCCSCFEIFDQISYCGWCNEPNTGDMEFSHWAGCNMCDGKSGWDRD